MKRNNRGKRSNNISDFMFSLNFILVLANGYFYVEHGNILNAVAVLGGMIYLIISTLNTKDK